MSNLIHVGFSSLDPYSWWLFTLYRCSWNRFTQGRILDSPNELCRGYDSEADDELCTCMSCFDLFKDHSLWCRNCLVSCKKAVYIDVITCDGRDWFVQPSSIATILAHAFRTLTKLSKVWLHTFPTKITRLATTLNNLVNNLPGPSSHNKRNWLLSQGVGHDTFVREIVWFPPLQCTICGIYSWHVENKDCNLILCMAHITQ
jgi:hypothetical protein